MANSTDTTIMIVDDEPENLRVLASLLDGNGHTVRSFTGGAAALKSAQSDPPDLILLDIRMPGMDGFETCSRLKTSDSLKHIPVIFLTAVDETEGKVRAFELGGADYVTKPFQSDEVLARIHTHLSISRYRTELESLNRELDQRVQERTSDLLATNKALREEIAGRRSAQKALQQSEEKYRRIVTTANEAIVTANSSYRVAYANHKALSLFKATKDQLLDRRVASLIHEADRQNALQRFQDRKAGKRETYECRVLSLDGEICWVLVAAAPIMDADGKFAGAVAMLTDITERKQAEIALQQSNDFNRSILMSLDDHIAVLDRQGKILVVNDSWMRFAQENNAASMDRISLGSDYLDVCRQSAESGSSDAQAAMDGIMSVLDGRQQTFKLEYSCHSPDKKRWFLMTVVRYEGQKGGLIVSHHDVTQLKQSGIQLEQAFVDIKRLKEKIEADKVYLQEEIKLEHDFDQIIGNSDEIKYVLYRVEQVAKTDSTVLVLGETGTGKELIVRALHYLSPRRDRPLVKVNCATLPDQFIESELFGHVKGAFTDASKDRQGRFELANGGSLFLDEIGELPLTLQTKLLRVLQDGEFERLGDSQTIHTDVRIIAATNRDLESLVNAGKFRQDLWYRLNVFPITIPPLRDRKVDIPLLVNHFVRKLSKMIGKDISEVSNSVVNEFTAYDWPGNVRELEHIIERSIITASGNRLLLTESLLKDEVTTASSPLKSHADMEREHILRVLNQSKWVIEGPRGAAKILNIHPNTLRYRMKKLGIKRPSN